MDYPGTHLCRYAVTAVKKSPHAAVLISTLLSTLLMLCAPSASGAIRAQEPHRVTVLDGVAFGWDEEAPPIVERDGLIVRQRGQVIERRLSLPTAPANQRDAVRILAVVEIEPVITTENERPRIADPWTRLGLVSVILGPPGAENPVIVELMRFITPFGGAARFEQDITSYAPVLSGETTLRLHVSTWFSPAWKATLRLEYRPGEAGYRRPKLVLPLIGEARITAGDSRRAATIDIPQAGIALPRLHILTSGHGGAQEFLTADHVVRVDGQEIIRFRPWREDGGTLHEANPTSHRAMLDGRELWSSDIDRAGWIPGSIVHPVRVPLPELTPGRHTIEIEVVGIPGWDVDTAEHGYWILSAAVVVDEPWPSPSPPPAP